VGQERLSGLSVISIENRIARNINSEKIIKLFFQNENKKIWILINGNKYVCIYLYVLYFNGFINININ
jgi:hypothetical protein